jgi:hypothetical protein
MYCNTIGADEVINYKTTKWTETLAGRVGTFHVIQSRTRVMGWHFSPRDYCALSASKHIQLTRASMVHVNHHHGTLK